MYLHFLEWSSKNQETIKTNLALYVFSCLQKSSFFSLKAMPHWDQALDKVALAFLSNCVFKRPLLSIQDLSLGCLNSYSEEIVQD
jgi:hypothetical protein